MESNDATDEGSPNDYALHIDTPMLRTGIRRASLILLAAATAHCGYETAAPGTYDPPGPGGSPGPNDPPIGTIHDGLWTVGGIDGAILRFAPSQLLTSDIVSPTTTVRTTTATLFTLNGVAFDDAGTMWVASREDSLVLAFTQSVLATSGIREASRVIAPTSRSLHGATALAFDRKHRLWVANIDGGTIVRFDSAQLASTGAPVPAKVVSVGGGQPSALAFDAAGALWVARLGAHSISKYSAAQLEAAADPVPDAVLSANGGSLHNPAGLAFDAAGNLWVANLGNRTVVAFSPAQLTATGAPVPRITLFPTSDSLESPTGLAFDAAGSLWVADADGVLKKFSSTALQASGAPAPNVRLQLNSGALLWNLAFWPKPRGLPLN